MSPRAGDLNNDGLMDLVCGSPAYLIVTYLQNEDGTLTPSDSISTRLFFRERPSPSLVDFNGDGLLDVVVAYHTKIGKRGDKFILSQINIYYNKGTKELAKFDDSEYENLYIDGKEANYEFCNIFFTDLNYDNKKDMLFFKSDKPENATFHYSINVSDNDSIVLGPIKDVKFMNSPLITDDSLPGNSQGNKLSISYVDTDNDGKKEFYFNTKAGYSKYSISGPVKTLNKLTKDNNNFNDIKYLGNKVILSNIINNSELSLIDLKGRVIDTRVITGDGNKEIDLGNLSSGNYFLRLKNSNSSQMLKLLKVE